VPLEGEFEFVSSFALGPATQRQGRPVLPDFSALLATGAGEAAGIALKEFAGQVRALFATFGFDLVLLEVALLQDRRVSGDRDFFMSHFFSYEAFLSQPVPILALWQELVAHLLNPAEAQAGKPQQDIVPNVATYDYVYCSAPVLVHDNHLASPAQTRGLDPRLADTRPIFTQSQRYLFEPLTKKPVAPDVQADIRYIAAHFATLLTRHSPLPSEFWEADLVVIPFFRLIDYSKARVNDLWKGFGGRPGGCLICVVGRIPTAQGQGRESAIKEPSIRLSWVLQKAALLEGVSRVEHDGFRATLLRQIGHSIQLPMTTAAKALKETQEHADRLGTSQESLAALQKLLRTASGFFDIALAAVLAIDLFLHLGPDVPAPERESYIQRHISGRARPIEILARLREEDFLRQQSVSLLIRERPEGNRTLISGSAEIWQLALSLLIKNAAEASPEGGAISAVLEEQLGLDRARLSLSNACVTPPSADFLERMNGALRGNVHHLEPDPRKPRSNGLGIAAVGKILAALGISEARYECQGNEVVLVIDDIPTM